MAIRQYNQPVVTICCGPLGGMRPLQGHAPPADKQKHIERMQMADCIVCHVRTQTYRRPRVASVTELET